MKRVVVGVVVLALAGCMGTAWTQAGKSQSQRDKDLASCERQSESDVLAGSGTNRGDYSMATSGPAARQDPRGISPLELKDRSELSNSFETAVARCMRAKGYAQSSR